MLFRSLARLGVRRDEDGSVVYLVDEDGGAAPGARASTSASAPGRRRRRRGRVSCVRSPSAAAGKELEARRPTREAAAPAKRRVRVPGRDQGGCPYRRRKQAAGSRGSWRRRRGSRGGRGRRPRRRRGGRRARRRGARVEAEAGGSVKGIEACAPAGGRACVGIGWIR